MDQVEKKFPDAKVIRVDGAVDGEKDIQASLEKFMEGEGDILLGTQIISKGLDSHKITLSVALNADLGLSLPDFRAAERDFQMLTQLAGRVGRGHLKGECIFQSHDPGHYAIRHAISQDYESFFQEEASYRQQLAYPPFARMARWVFQHGVLEKLIKELNRLSVTLRPIAKECEVQLLGPVPAPLSKVKTRHRYQLVAKSQSASKLDRFIGQAMKSFRSLGKVDWYLDRDPQNMM
jgi:primosomal protein N' (replication factor Y)